MNSLMVFALFFGSFVFACICKEGTCIAKMFNGLVLSCLGATLLSCYAK